MTIIRTDNFSRIYERIADINQGVAPSEVRRYQHVIKKLIIDRGKKGTLDTLLMSPNEMDDMDETIKNKNLVIAIGDKTIIYKMPTIVQYMYEYISEKEEQNVDVILRFIAAQNPNARLPLSKYLTRENIDGSQLHINEKNKLYKRMKTQLNLSKQNEMIGHSTKYNSLDAILENENKTYKIQRAIAYNIDKLPLEDVKEYILCELEQCIKNGEITVHTELRRLCLIYDLYLNHRE